MMTGAPSAADVLRRARRAAGLSQRELARRAGTSSATVSQYESGHKEPRLDTLARLLDTCGHRLEVRAVRLRSSAQDRQDRRTARSRALHRAIAERLRERPAAVLAHARHNLATLRAANTDGSADPWLDCWAGLLAGPLDVVVGVLTTPEPWADELRQNTPFAGILAPRERWDIYREHAA